MVDGDLLQLLCGSCLGALESAFFIIDVIGISITVVCQIHGPRTRYSDAFPAV
jgi:hypothetical protein